MGNCHCSDVCSCNLFKHIPTAILLSFFLGPFGLLYANFWLGVAITVIGLASLFIPNSQIGFSLLFLCWLVCPFLSVYFTNRYNHQLHHYLCHAKSK